ncbi:PIG-L family deacetylase [bacterium]|nr:PIG-L family deacetylase [bacterium]
MSQKDDAFARGDAFAAGLRKYKRPLWVFAHHDDELSYCGLLHRTGIGKNRLIWTTNSDGLYFEMDMEPAAYGEIRKAEGIKAVAEIGMKPAQTSCLDVSEVEIYKRLAGLSSGKARIFEVRDFFDDFRAKVRDAVLAADPDIVFTQAYQAGQPEHDLTHYFTALAVRELAEKRGAAVPFFHLPAYEYTILIPMRFNPFYRGTRYRIRLTDEEMAAKQRMIEAYPSQQRLFRDFTKVFLIVGAIGAMTGGSKSAREHLSIEEFGPVPLGFDYAKSPHVLEKANYIGDHYLGEAVTWKGSIKPIVQAFL